MLNKSGPMNPAKRGAAPAAPVALIPNLKPKDPTRPIKPSITLVNSTSTVPAAPKMGPTTFHTAETTSVVATTTQTSTITLVNPQAERRPLGPPSRPSAMAPIHQSTVVQQTNHNRASTVLQQSRKALQSQLDEKALEIQSEDIVLPDIASEYVQFLVP